MMNATGPNTQQTLPFKSTSSQEDFVLPDTNLKAFELDGVVYIRVIPGKKLFNSTMVHSVVNRGDIFAVRLEDSMLTIIPGNAKVRHFSLNVGVASIGEKL